MKEIFWQGQELVTQKISKSAEAEDLQSSWIAKVINPLILICGLFLLIIFDLFLLDADSKFV